MRHLPVRLSILVVLVAVTLGASSMAPAQPKVTEVLIGSVLPLTGNFASLGQQYLWASQTAEDIVNNDYADLQVPLGPGKGFPGLGGAPIKFIVRDDQSRGEQARTIVEQLISVNKVHWINGEGTSGSTSIIQPVVESAGIPDVLFLVQYTAETTVFQNDAKRAGFTPRVIATSNGAYSDETWLQAQKKTNGGSGWLGRDPTAIDLTHQRTSWKKVNEIYKKYSRGQNMGELAMREITGLLWMADVINRARSVEPAALPRAARETNMGPGQLIIDYKGIKFDDNQQNTLATGVVTQIGWDGEKHTLWPWDLASKAGFKPIFPNPGWPERDSTPKPAS